MANSPKRLFRSRGDRMLAGVCGGLGEYLNVDPTLIRLLTVLLTIWFPFLLLAYLVLFIVVPLEPSVEAPTSPEAVPAGENGG
jgi:phage shock protein C